MAAIDLQQVDLTSFLVSGGSFLEERQRRPSRRPQISQKSQKLQEILLKNTSTNIARKAEITNLTNFQ